MTKSGKRGKRRTLRPPKPGPHTEISESHLSRARKLEALGRLAGGFAHDFNNILMTIGVNAELARFGAVEGSAQERYLGLAIRAADRGKILVKRIMTLAREALETGAVPPTSQSRPDKRILLVDDEETILFGVRDLLEQVGYEVAAAKSGLDALALFDAEPRGFDVVVTDQMMPHMSGEELAQQLFVRRPELPVIVCTGFSEETVGDKTRARGLLEFVTKPYSLQEIDAAIRRVLERAQLRRGDA